MGPDERAKAWQRLGSEQFDVLVVGGGVTGAGVALDAVTRGLRVALVEARDFASGTSSRSSKLLHGGLRYLEQLNLGLVREALRERELMLTRLAPHLVKPVSFLYPLTHRFWERPYVGAGLMLYDTMGGAGAQAVRIDRGTALLRRAGRRRPAHPHRGQDRRVLRRDGPQLRRGGRLSARRRARRGSPRARRRDR